MNCQTIQRWYHIDEHGQQGLPARWGDLSRWERWHHGGPWLDPDLLRFHHQMITESAGAVYVAREKDTIVGEIELLFTSKPKKIPRAHLAWILVHPDWQHQGIGSLLVQQGLEWAKEKGCSYVSTYPEHEAVYSFIRKQKFTVSNQLAQFTKPLIRREDRPRTEKVQTLPLEWKMRRFPPNGFNLEIGDNYTPRYTWSYLRQMDQLYALLNSKNPLPHLWLLRRGDDEALTVDYEFVRIWLSETVPTKSDFLQTTLRITENLAKTNNVKKMVAYAFSSHYKSLEKEGFKLQREYPYLTLSL